MKELEKLKKFKAENKGRYIEEEEFYKVLSYAPNETYELAYLLMGSRTIIVQDNVDQLLEHMNELKNMYPTSGNIRLFPLKHGMLSVIFSRMKQNQLKEASAPESTLKGRLYDLRHAAITNFYLKGLTPFLMEWQNG
ncbi:MAG: hypothetical protein ACTSRI_21575 [Promethearchaeota archaeon]